MGTQWQIGRCPGMCAMSSPAKVLQVQSVYGTAASQLGTSQLSNAPEAVGCISPSRKRAPSKRQPAVTRLRPLPGTKATVFLSPQQRKQWMQDAQEVHASSSLHLAVTTSENLQQPAHEELQFVTHPVLARHDEKLETQIRAATLPLCEAKSKGLFAAKILPEGQARHRVWPSRVAKAHKKRKTTSLAIEPLLSSEMRAKLQAHLEAKIQGNIWENEVRSRLARPLSASSFCPRREQLAHPLAAPQLPTALPIRVQSSEENEQGPRMFPYSKEAHSLANRIRGYRIKYCLRIALKARARALAVAIRVLRLRGMPLLIRGFRCRRRAAILIQRRFRRFLRWREEVLIPCIRVKVSGWIHYALVLANARITIARAITALFLARKVRREQAARRVVHLGRWVAKTRVCLFVHRVWTVRWFHRKRERNVRGMEQELAAFEASDHDVHVKYQAVFASPIGKQALKKEVAAWRVGARRKAAQEGVMPVPNPSDDSSETDPALLRLRQCFQIFDLDGSGTLDLEEFQLMLSYLRGSKQSSKRGEGISAKKQLQQPPKLTTAQVRNLFADLDGDGNGSITCAEFERWWQHEHKATAISTSASTTFLSRGLDGLLLQSHGLLFWLLGRKQQLERKFVKKLMVRRAMDSAKQDLLQQEVARETVAGAQGDVFRCPRCARRFGLRRDVIDHREHECNFETAVLDTFVLKRWIREEELRLLEDGRP